MPLENPHASEGVPADFWVRWPAEEAARYRKAGYWRGETFGDQLDRWAARFGRRTALVDGGSRWSYAELNAGAERLATGLRELGLRRGQRVVVQLPNCAEFVIVWFALLRLGVVPVHALPGHRRNEITHLATLAEATAYFFPDQHDRFDYRELAEEVATACPGLKHLVVLGDPQDRAGFTSLNGLMATPADPDGNRADPPAADDIALLLLSGGTTGTPKLIPRTHDDYAYNARQCATVARMDADSVYLAVLPIAFNYTMSCPGLLGTLQVGGTVVMASNPYPRTAFRLIERERVTITSLNPTLVPHWLAELDRGPADLSSLRVLQVGSARLADDVAATVVERLDCTLQQVFGMSEGLICLTRLDDPVELLSTTQGVPVSDDDEILIVDGGGRPVPDGQVGELLTRGPYTLRGYYRAPEQNRTSFTEDGFYRTGDQVRRLPSGHLTVIGRVKDQINRGGVKIDATEVEGHLLAHPEIVSAALVPEADGKLGERSVAFLVVSGEQPSVKTIGAFLRGRGLAPYKAPDRVEIVAQMPLTAVGKIDKKALAATYIGRRP
ncbi:(2,3-dihydroxybenzoyl)adenylate synthase [Streptomyces silvisoli]|uniref:(2,3-dihydroxybenzoyl)adenylate synthase n=1 Tax=Streptomyces silvisoli TaxID=3034235 RepID=A0ABT5ZKZ2_9ACTN|nr:(2,3-dihydroxybenzoyl)adenylate synthase [Streptomyces silvisoli]MDF3290506.1 (2,3-dihydroxybenzoyl)adenylate synthase [Streptomyces silvisoli]